MIVPSFFNIRQVGGEPTDDGGAFGDVSLRVGEVLELVYPEDPRSQTKRFIEYRVLVRHRANKTAVTKEYVGCCLWNPLGGFVDRATWTLRGDQQAGQKGRPAKGSKVLLLCINGERANPVILGGIRDQRDESEAKGAAKERGHFLELEFNGLNVEIDDSGALKVLRKGPTDADGKLDENKVKPDAVGAFIRFGANGGIAIGTFEAKDENDERPLQRLVLDHHNRQVSLDADKALNVTVVGGATVTAKGVTVEAAEDGVLVKAAKKNVTLSAPGGQVKVGAGAKEKMVLGDTLVSLMEELIDACAQLTVITAVGSSSPPVNAPAFMAVRAKLKTALSELGYVQKSKG